MRKTILQWTCIFLLTFSVSLWGQSVSGTLSGRVTAAGGAGVPNAAITLTNTSTNVSQKVLSGSDGSFSVSGLAPGTYRMEVETAGYKRTSQLNIDVTSSAPAVVNVTLEAGNTNETVEIQGVTPTVQSQSGDVSTSLGTRVVRELPVIDRNHQQLVGLQSGVTPPQPALDQVRDPERNRYYSTNGQAPWNNEHFLDGVANQEPFRNSAIRITPTEAVQQKDIVTSSPPATQGFAGGALVTNLTRGGTNGWHGSLFEFYSGNVLRTRNFFNTPNNPDPRFVYNQMGATAGGALVPDHTFFFGSYEGTFRNGYTTEMATVPTAGAMSGNFNAVPGLTLFNPNSGFNGANRTPFPGNRIPANMINPTAATIASFLPEPNQPGFVNNYVSNVLSRNHMNKADVRIDQHFTDRTSAFLRYGFSNDWSAEGSPLGNVIGAGTRGRLLAHNAILDLAHEFSPSLVTDFRVGYNRYDQRLNPFSDQTALGTALGLSDFSNNLIGINISGLQPIGAPAYVPQSAVDNTFNWVWTWGWHTSMHNVKWGVDVRRNRSDGFTDTMWGNLYGPNGTAYFGPGATLTSNGMALSQFGQLNNAFAAFLLGAPSQVGINNFLTTPTIRQTQYAAWIGDSVKLMNRVTLDLGVRYEIYSPLEPRNPGGAQFFDAQRNVFSYAGIGDIAMHSSLYDLDNIAPRVGLAFRLTDKTVLRGGYAINYFQTPYMLSGFMAPTFGAVNGVQGGFTTAQFQGAFGPTVSSTLPPPDSLTNGASAGNLPVALTPHRIETPYAQTFSLQLQQDFYWGTMLSLGYVGALDRHLPYSSELNAALPGTGIAGLPFAPFGRTASTLFYDTGLNSNYNSLQVNLNKRFARGLSFLASYTWSKSLGYTGNNGMLLNPFNLRANYGPLDFDRQHVLSIGHLWELPFGRHGGNIASTLLGGWQLNGIFTWNTGTPLTVTADPISCACPGSTVFANLNGSPYLNNGMAFLNPAAFLAPGFGQFGNLGRGALRAQDNWNYDLSLFKNFRVRDRFNLQLRGEAYNLTNTAQFAMPVTNINSPDFGQTVSTVNGSFGRQINLGLRVTF